MAALEVEECSASGPDFTAVLRLQKSAKQTVGFLRDSAIRDRAEKGTLLLARIDEEVAGYLLYDLPRNEIRIVQLVVAPTARRSGTAKALVDALATRHPARIGIVLECRRDFEAAAVWPKLGFTPLNEREGRGKERKPLTKWRRDFGHPDLFSMSAADDERPVAALDANIVIDLSDGLSTPSRHLMEDWVGAACRLAVTDEVYVEIERRNVREDRVRHKRHAQGLEQLTPSPETWPMIESSLTARLGERAKAHPGDIRHVAKAAATGARWFVTRDDAFRRACSGVVEEATGVFVVAPAQFALEVDRFARDDQYRPADLAGSEIEIRPLSPDELDDVCRSFVNQPDGERLRDLRSSLNALVADIQHVRSCLFALRGQPLALSVLRATELGHEVAVCRVQRGRTETTLARHMLGWLRAYLPATGTVTLVDSFSGAAVMKAARSEGFLETPRGLTAVVVRGIGSMADLQISLKPLIADGRLPAAIAGRVREADATPGTAFELEAAFHPYRVIGNGLPTFLVPIRAAWAAELIDPSLSRAQLFPRSTALALQREHVYYRSPRASGGLRAPGRILWYVSGTGIGGRSVRAVSHLEEVVTGDARRLHRRFAHLGVYDEAQVVESADHGDVMALRFSRSTPLPRPVGLDDYRRLMTEHRPGAGLTLAGPHQVPEHVFDQIVRMGG
jgi:GNAT superfamily N-acetyltransferase/predicted nucleic acid-binding protein